MVGRVAKPTKAEKERLSKLHELPCLCCEMRGIEQPNRTTAHHLLSGGKRRGHRFSVNLCEWHHYGKPAPGNSDTEMTEYYGPSLLFGSRAFHEAFGADEELLARADEMLESV